MLRKNSLMLSAFILVICQSLLAQIPTGYYNNADSKKYIDLKSALGSIIANHTVFSYSSLWEYYPSTYYVPDNSTQVLDMYSNTVRYYSTSSQGSAVSGMNKEHTVPKSWWGGTGQCNGYSDIFNVIPSDADANSRKSNYPVGEVKSVTWTNKVTTIGPSAVSGYSGTVFEPCDEYKGDFARIYFYMATCYPNAAWDSHNADAMTNASALTLQSWIIPLLLKWHAEDPVDQSEIQRNEDIYKVQRNRNPFIDYPILAEYIWGTKSQETFILSEHKPNEGESGAVYAAQPTFSVDYGTEAQPKLVAEGTKIVVKGGSSTSILYTRTNGGAWVETKPKTGWNETAQVEYHINAEIEYIVTEDMCIEAYCTHVDREPSATIRAYYKAVNYDDDYLLYEAFDEAANGNHTDTSGSSSAWGGNANFPKVETAYQAGNAIRLGTGKKPGSLTSRELFSRGGDMMVSIDVKGWTTVEGTLLVELTGAGTQTITYKSTIEDAFETHQLFFHNVAANPTLTIRTSDKRAFVDNVSVQQDEETSISETTITSTTTGAIYNLQGQKLQQLPRTTGIYIVNGRKVIMR